MNTEENNIINILRDNFVNLNVIADTYMQGNYIPEHRLPLSLQGLSLEVTMEYDQTEEEGFFVLRFDLPESIFFVMVEGYYASYTGFNTHKVSPADSVTETVTRWIPSGSTTYNDSGYSSSYDYSSSYEDEVSSY